MHNSHSASSLGFFENAHHFNISGSQFTNYVHNQQAAVKDGFQILQEHVAPAAFHNSKERFNPPRCHERTREVILEELFDWIVGNVSQDKWMAWLNGAAGAGKSAICQTIAEICIQRGIKVASFFFFRTDNTRNKIDPLVATLVYQIIQLFPGMKNYIVASIQSNPLIFQQSFEAQLDILIIQPLRHLQVFSPNWQLLVIIDGVDECSGNNAQMNLIRIISKVLVTKRLPLIFLFGSRCETQLQMAFNSRNMAEILTQFPLDDHYEPDADIRHFLTDSFDDIKETHPFRSRLNHIWPLPDHIQEIIKKSSGQFIYASVVVEFLSDPSSNPSTRLDIIRGLRPSGRLTPYAQLDALYRHIFAQVDDLPTVLDLLAYTIFVPDYGKAFKSMSLKSVLFLLGLTEDDVQEMLAPLTSVLILDLKHKKISFRHASLPDFLRDEKRSERYCIRTLPTRLSILLLCQLASGKYADIDDDHQNWGLPQLLDNAEATADLYTSLSEYAPLQQRSAFAGSYYYGVRFLNAVAKLDFSDGGKLYGDMLHRIVRFLDADLPDNGSLRLLEEEQDVSHILDQIAHERGFLTLQDDPTQHDWRR
ncbi:hypothetical protein HYPSUDRAFT_203626 [Hypholoma sublateritium FD-334 SS-4]|uniref:Nephrocystin 3-like N-terminal domain-containing protein n=1 Tax=Hypholoma sublateritium (strain FD-334 SS-4) TaxID=945553 RepID=A0A0D2NPD8_HYPSF|nr:hypothetical protein HYPSUDRAFT_203626 [Hypholoma sublateritium FD-334 SS-4]